MRASVQRKIVTVVSTIKQVARSPQTQAAVGLMSPGEGKSVGCPWADGA
jgi:hypothetical protein